MGSIEWELVESSNVASIGYDKEKSELHVQFHSGAQYVYRGVSVEVYHEFLVAESKGRYLNEHIKGVYEYEKIG